MPENTKDLEKKIITVITPTGEEIEAEVLIFFGFSDIGKKYLVYTHHEKDKNEMVTVYASEYVEENGNIYLENIENDEEWERVKNVMRDVIKTGRDK